MDNFKPNFKTPPSATNPTPTARPDAKPLHGGKQPHGNPGNQGWQKPNQPKKVG